MEGCENDLTKLTTNLLELKQVLKGKMPDDLILDSYSDANKPFSELWNEEGLTFIKNPIGAFSSILCIIGLIRSYER